MSVQGTMFNPFMNGYSSYAAMGDLYGLDNYNYSAYGSPMAYGGYGAGGYNYQQYYDNMLQMQEYQSKFNLHSVELQRHNDIAINNADYGIKKAFEILQTKIVSNEQEQIIGALENLQNAVREKYPTATDTQIANYTSRIYSQLSGGTSLPQDILTHGSSSFAQGFKQAIGLGLFADNKTAEENIAEISGQPESRSSQMAKHSGRAAGGACVGAAAGAATGAAIGAAGGPIGAGAGAIIGALVGCIGAFITSKAAS